MGVKQEEKREKRTKREEKEEKREQEERDGNCHGFHYFLLSKRVGLLSFHSTNCTWATYLLLDLDQWFCGIQII